VSEHIWFITNSTSSRLLFSVDSFSGCHRLTKCAPFRPVRALPIFSTSRSVPQKSRPHPFSLGRSPSVECTFPCFWSRDLGVLFVYFPSFLSVVPTRWDRNPLRWLIPHQTDVSARTFRLPASFGACALRPQKSQFLSDFYFVLHMRRPAFALFFRPLWARRAFLPHATLSYPHSLFCQSHSCLPCPALASCLLFQPFASRPFSLFVLPRGFVSSFRRAHSVPS